jgi:ABC-type glycerol-3-phosphate transport system permease component
LKRQRRLQDLAIHTVLIAILAMTLLPFVFVINNSFRTNTEMNHSFFGLPEAALEIVGVKAASRVTETKDGSSPFSPQSPISSPSPLKRLTQSYVYAWEVLRPYVLNTLFVCVATAFGVVLFGSVSAYVFSRYKFPGHRALFLVVLSFMMIPGVLTLVPSFLWVKQLGLLNSYWVLILPYIAGGQIFAIFVFKGFFDGLPGELFESARMDGAGHFSQYWHLVLPLSKQIIAVVLIVNVLGTWNNFLWPFITNTDSKYHVISSGLFTMSSSSVAANYASMYAAYVLASIPMLILFIYATKPFMSGVTSGAFKA